MGCGKSKNTKCISTEANGDGDKTILVSGQSVVEEGKEANDSAKVGPLAVETASAIQLDTATVAAQGLAEFVEKVAEESAKIQLAAEPTYLAEPIVAPDAAVDSNTNKSADDEVNFVEHPGEMATEQAVAQTGNKTMWCC